MKRLALALLCTAGVAAAQADTFFDNARVRGVEPQYENVTVPRQECSSQWITEQRRVGGGGGNNIGGTVIGGVAGGLLGNQVGGGHGREAATALGAVVGALTGNNIANGNRAERYEEVPRQVNSCR
ncbi:MAG: glycine zipper 2TM domain-containing protein, partial [Ramlibacter sp.]